MKSLVNKTYRIILTVLLILSMIITYSFSYSYGTTAGDYGYVNTKIGLNVRSGPSISYDIKDDLDNNTKVNIYEERFTTSSSSSKSNIWIAINSSKTSFVRSDFIDNVVYDTVKGTTNVDLNYRVGAGTGMRRIGTFNKGKSIDIACEALNNKGELWYKVKVGSSYYYVSSKYVSLSSSNESNSEDIKEEDATENIDTNEDYDKAYVDSIFGLNVRKGPSTSYSKVGRLSNNEKINVYSEKFVSSYNYSDKYIWLNISNADNKYVRSDYVDNYSYETKSGVTTTKLNYRMGAGVGMKYAGTFSNGASVEVIGDAYDSKGGLWYKVKIGNKYYYAYAKYINFENSSSEEETNTPIEDKPVEEEVVVTADSLITKGNVDAKYGLNIRKGPGINYSIAGLLINNKEILIYEEKFVSSSRYDDRYIWLVLNESDSKYVRSDFIDGLSYENIQGTTTTNLNYRKGAGTGMPLVGTFNEGQTINIVAKARSNNNQLWYKVKVGSRYYYVSADYVSLSSGNNSGDSEINVPTKPNMTNEEFETFIEEQGFPESYKVELRKMHAEHPSWIFYAQQIDIPFETVVDKESQPGTYSPSLIHEIYPESYKSVADGDYIFGQYAKTKVNGSANSIFIYNNGEFNILNETYTSSTSTSKGYIWYEVEFNGKSGYVKASNVYGEAYHSEIAVANHSTNIREGAGTSMNILGKYQVGDEVNVVMAVTDSAGMKWYKIEYNDNYAYVYAPNFDLQGDLKIAKGKLLDKGEYIPHDASCWFTADESAVQHYMDPRNFINSDDIYMFEDLSYHEEYQTEELVNKIISGTQLDKNGFKASWFIEAGRTYEVSPVHLAARAKVETGGGTGYAISGVTFTYGSSTYSGIYNPYNIGATSCSNPAAKGLYWAATGSTYQRPWNDKKTSVLGGAQFISNGYINNNQNSIYTQKFNVDNGLSNVATHQYMTNITAPLQEAGAVKSQYEELGIIDEQLAFIIPVYKDMQIEPYEKPNSSGNNNCYLSNLEVVGYNMDQSFDKDVLEYSVTCNADSIELKAIANSMDSIVQGIGNRELVSGSNVFEIKITSSSGKEKIYKITVNKE